MDTNPKDLQRLIHLLWSRSTLDPIDIRIQTRVVTPLRFPKPDFYLVLETMTDPCADQGINHLVLEPMLVEGDQHAVELLSPTMPFWVVALPANGFKKLQRLSDIVFTINKNPDSVPPDHILRWRVAVAT